MSDLTVIPESERELRGLELAALHFPPERRAQVASFLRVPPEDPALLPYLAVCASLNLSPISGHVWLLPQRVTARDGDDDTIVYRPAIGRDGLLHKARQTKGQAGGYKGMKFGVVCERDSFEVFEDGSFDGPQILHRFAMKPTEFRGDDDPSRYRGRVVGAWAKCFIDGEPPVFYYASVHEHAMLRQVHEWNSEARRLDPLYRHPNGGVTFAPFSRLADDAGVERHEPVVEFEGTWEYLSTMILKSAQSYVLRIGLGVTGVVPVDELRGGKLGAEAPDASVTTSAAGFAERRDFDVRSLLTGADEELRERIARAVDQANENDPFAWGPAKCEMVFTARAPEELVGIVEGIERENGLRERRLVKSSEERPPAEAAPATVEEAPSDEERARRVAGLYERQTALLSELPDVEGDEKTRMRAELDGVEAELRQLGEEV